MGRVKRREEGGLKLQIANAGEEVTGRGGRRGELRLNSQIENAEEEGMRRGVQWGGEIEIAD